MKLCVQVRVNAGLLDCGWEVRLYIYVNGRHLATDTVLSHLQSTVKLVHSLHPCVFNNEINSIKSINRMDFERDSVFSARRT